MTSNGTTFYVAQGETFDAVFDITDADGAAYNLAGGSAALSYWQNSGAATKVTGVVSTTTVTITIARATIKAMSGIYNYEFWAKNAAGKIVRSVLGIIQVDTAKDPDAVA